MAYDFSRENLVGHNPVPNELDEGALRGLLEGSFASDASPRRADYAPTQMQSSGGAVVASVAEGSPAARAGLVPGAKVIDVDDEEIEDIIDWFWLSDGYDVSLTCEFPDGTQRSVNMEREPMESWGFEFSDNVFDGVRTCCNSCAFCFMSMLPKGMRSGMYLRDDDYRLSFLQGNFVTLTNMSDEDVDKIIAMDLSPIHVSLHALDPDARLQLMGKNHQRGLDVMRELLSAGIDLHLQVVLVPGVNDGRVLDELAGWAVEQEHVLSLGIVPLGFTRFQDRFDKSFGNPADALAVIDQMKPFQRRARELYGCTKVHLADEFYVNAYPGKVLENLPESWEYDDYPQFFDGIGMLRSLADEWRELVGEAGSTAEAEGSGNHGGHADSEASRTSKKVLVVCGTALQPIMQKLLDNSPFAAYANAVGIENRFFGGNVDVTGLLTGADVREQLPEWMQQIGGTSNSESLDHGSDATGITAGIGKGGSNSICAKGFSEDICVILPEAMFNDDGLTLDNLSAADIESDISCPVSVVCYSASEIFDLLKSILG